MERDIGSQLLASSTNGLMTREEYEELSSHYALLRQIMQVARLTVEGDFNPDTTGKGVIEILLQQTGMNSLETLSGKVQNQTGNSKAIISDLIDKRWKKWADG
ncbi:MAG: hypothetical protein OXH47_00845, partial [Paracoccaceae bacterium]|nr:hypothetical protein [Paracoccaceae bacterium]